MYEHLIQQNIPFWPMSLKDVQPIKIVWNKLGARARGESLTHVSQWGLPLSLL